MIITRLPFNRRRTTTREQETQTSFLLSDLNLDNELDLDVWKSTCIPKMTFLGEGIKS